MGFKDLALGTAGISTVERDQARAMADLQKQIQRTLNPKRTEQLATKFLPEVREQFASSAIPALQSVAAVGNARGGLTGTGLGSVIAAAGEGAGELGAVSAALDRARAQQQSRVNALLGFAGVQLAGPSESSLVAMANENLASKGGSVFGMNIKGTGGNTGGIQNSAGSLSGSSSNPFMGGFSQNGNSGFSQMFGQQGADGGDGGGLMKLMQGFGQQ